MEKSSPPASPRFISVSLLCSFRSYFCSTLKDAHVLCIDKWAGLAGQGPKDSLASVLSQLSVEQGDRLR